MKPYICALLKEDGMPSVDLIAYLDNADKSTVNLCIDMVATAIYNYFYKRVFDGHRIKLNSVYRVGVSVSLRDASRRKAEKVVSLLTTHR
jgi:hypothetical protein